MKRIIILLVCLGLVSGCAFNLDRIRANNRTNLSRLSLGMSKLQVVNLMGDKTILGDDGTIINNPYRSEILQGKDKILEVLYYYTEKKAADNIITLDELTPIAFDNEKLIGWGWNFLKANMEKFEIKALE